MSDILSVAKTAATAGGEVIARYFKDGVTMRHKAQVDLVSDADVEAEATIAAVIRDNFPDHAIMGEETHQADASAEHLWVIDPLDGTTNFAHGIPHFAVSIAYYQNGIAEVGVVLNPITDDWYIAEKGKGATFNGAAASVSTKSSVNEVLIGVGFYYDRGSMMEATLKSVGELFRQNIHGIRRFGTASLDLCNVGIGRYGAFFEYQLSPWDFAAGRLFVEEAGGKVSTCQGEELPLEKTTVLASNSLLHDEVLKTVSQNWQT